MMSPRCSVEQPTKPRTTIIENAKRIVAIQCKPNPTAFNQHRDLEATFCGLKRKAFTLDQQSLAVTNARFASLHGLPVVPYAFSTTPIPLRKSARSSRACMVQGRKSGGLPSAARRRDVALRLRFAMRCSPPPLHFPRSPTADRSRTIIFFAPFGAFQHDGRGRRGRD